MPRDLVVGNGSLLVAFDSQYRLADFYYPRVGMENQSASRFRFGVWADDKLHWVEERGWRKQLGYLRDTLVTDVQCENEEAGLRMRCHDAVDVDSNVLLRKIVVRNTRDVKRSVKLFLHHDFSLYGNAVADTVYFDPETQAVIHYKARRYVLINVAVDDRIGVTEYACGRSGISGVEGTWRDAEDGVLSMSAIAQGAVDSTIGITLELEPLASTAVLYWICAGRRYGDVGELDRKVREEGASRMMSRTASYWYTWSRKGGQEELADLADDLADLYRRSLLVISTQCDRGGAVIAANDSDIQWGHNDHYSYMWTRDAVFVCDAMDRAGYPDFTRRFVLFANKIIKNDGFFLHKYHPDGSLASLWHPWVRDGKPQLPIQEDETALVIWLLARHYERTRDLDLVRTVYTRLVVNAAEFLVGFRDPSTGLPLPSFDIWEERQGVFTFTCCAVVAALEAAAELANLFNDQERRTRYESTALEIRDAMLRHLWLTDEQRFARGLVVDGEKLALDTTVDASAFGAFYFNVFAPRSAVVESTMRSIREQLAVRTEAAGFARYHGDAYHRISEDTTRVPGNPWIITALWLAEYEIARAESMAELETALDMVWWVRSKALPSFILPEQVNPYDGTALSVAPLTWSHAQLVSTIRAYLDKRAKLRAGNERDSKENDEKSATPNPVDNP